MKTSCTEPLVPSRHWNPLRDESRRNEIGTGQIRQALGLFHCLPTQYRVRYRKGLRFISFTH